MNELDEILGASYKLTNDIIIGCQYNLNAVISSEISVERILADGMTNGCGFLRYNPLITTTTVMKVSDDSRYIIGGKMHFNGGLREANRFKLTFGYLDDDASLVDVFEDIRAMNLSYYKLNSNVQIGARLNANYYSHLSLLVAAKVALINTVSVKGKIDNLQSMGLALIFNFKEDDTKRMTE